jgi:hypothetical protein
MQTLLISRELGSPRQSEYASSAICPYAKKLGQYARDGVLLTAGILVPVQDDDLNAIQ